MAQTALQELIEYFENICNNIYQGNHSYLPYKRVIKKAKSLLPKDRQTHEDAYNAGVIDWLKDDTTITENGADYFTQNFNQ
jgi:hypothetical protein